jgi:hypothetical protein
VQLASDREAVRGPTFSRRQSTISRQRSVEEAAGGIATLSTGRIAATLEKAGILNARR